MVDKNEQAISNFKKRLRAEKVVPLTLDSYLKAPQKLVGRQFVGFDHDYSRKMIYRVDRFDTTTPSLVYISELTVIPRARVCPFISVSLHKKDVEVTDLNLEEVAKALELPTNMFHFYV
jgi:hypothetical protein